MIKRLFCPLLFLLVVSFSHGQTDSTALTLYKTPAVLATSLDSILYGGGGFEMVNLDFTISDTLSFGKVLIELHDGDLGHLLFVKSYTYSALASAGLIDSAWQVSIPFGNLSSTASYTVKLTLANFAGALGTTLSKTLLP